MDSPLGIVSAMPNNRFRILLEKVLARTKDGALPWEETPNENAFQVMFERGALVVSQKGRYDEAEGRTVHTITVTVFNRDGRIVEENTVHESDADYRLTRQLYQEARSRARESDDVIEELISELG
jgi:hypothetical protein